MSKGKNINAAYMARVYLQQARNQRHRGGWHATLLNWAAKCRRAYGRQPKDGQMELLA